VWREKDRYHLLLRVVNRNEDASLKVARIHYGTSVDGIHFELEERPVLEPSADPAAYDNGGCEDPSLATVNSFRYVYYTGWNEHQKRGELLLATGSDMHRLIKRGIALQSTEDARNPKEAEIVQAADGTWRLFFEYAHENRSKIGIAASTSPGGPWRIQNALFDARESGWDCHHLSTGPVIPAAPGTSVMFYNGATRDAQWRVGWVMFDNAFSRVIARCEEPLVLPHIKRNHDDTDIAFAASAIATVPGEILLYYSVADQYVVQARIRQR
jgi:predicted GH43/DUF377 family glycosyl hydrolase